MIRTRREHRCLTELGRRDLSACSANHLRAQAVFAAAAGLIWLGLGAPGIEIGPGTYLNLAECRFVGGPVDLTGARFVGGRATFAGHTLEDGARFLVDSVVVEGAPFDGPDVPPQLAALIAPA